MCSCSKRKSNAAPASTIVIYQDGTEKAFQSAITAAAVANRTPGAYVKPMAPVSA
jgi:hypothetical protein